MVRFVANAKLPTLFGEFEVYSFLGTEGAEHLALVKGEVASSMNVRVHSKCQTGDALCSLRCDCRGQLEKSMTYCAKNGGMIIYLDQEGRGIGLANKIKAYALQDRGLDTLEANEALGFGDDLRDYKDAAEILSHFKISSVNLLTNNPEKVADLERHGIHIVKRIPLHVLKTKYNSKYLATKKDKMNHWVD